MIHDPRYVLERYPLLKALKQAGINSFDVTRLDSQDRPNKYPVFVRSEDDCRGSETDLLNTEAELERAVEELFLAGKTMKRRIAVEFSAERNADGYYRKYGVFNINGVIVPQHILRSREWMVKSTTNDYDQEFVQEELAFVRDNPHQEQLKEIFKIANTDFGRVDYGIVNGGAQVQASLRPRERFRDIQAPKIDSAFDSLLVPRTSWSPTATR